MDKLYRSTVEGLTTLGLFTLLVLAAARGEHSRIASVPYIPETPVDRDAIAYVFSSAINPYPNRNAEAAAPEKPWDPMAYALRPHYRLRFTSTVNAGYYSGYDWLREHSSQLLP